MCHHVELSDRLLAERGGRAAARDEGRDQLASCKLLRHSPCPEDSLRDIGLGRTETLWEVRANDPVNSFLKVYLLCYALHSLFKSTNTT